MDPPAGRAAGDSTRPRQQGPPNGNGGSPAIQIVVPFCVSIVPKAVGFAGSFGADWDNDVGRVRRPAGPGQPEARRARCIAQVRGRSV